MKYKTDGTPYCEACAPGYYAEPGSNFCRACPWGTWSRGSVAACAPCAAGTTYSGSAARTCYPCDAGTCSCAGSTAGACTNCTAGAAALSATCGAAWKPWASPCGSIGSFFWWRVWETEGRCVDGRVYTTLASTAAAPDCPPDMDMDKTIGTNGECRVRKCSNGKVPYGGGCFADPCAASNGGCDAVASCSVGGYGAVCTCPAGYTLSGKNCISKCATNNGGCAAGYTCLVLANGTAACAPPPCATAGDPISELVTFLRDRRLLAQRHLRRRRQRSASLHLQAGFRRQR